MGKYLALEFSSLLCEDQLADIEDSQSVEGNLIGISISLV